MIPFTKPDLNEADCQAVLDVLRSGWITTGPVTKAFEREIADYLGVRRAALLASQTFAAETALRLLGVGPGDEVIVPAYTYTASASVICHVGARPVFLDCLPMNPETETYSLGVDWSELHTVLTDRTKAVISVDLAGIPVAPETILAELEAHRPAFRSSDHPYQRALGRVAWISDSAHSFGAAVDGRMAGSLADFSAFSFHAVKNLTTAEGGCLTWRSFEGMTDDEIYREVMLQSLHGQSKDALAKTKLGQWAYDIVDPLYKGNMTDVHAAIGRSQFARYGAMQARRAHLVARYDEAFREAPVHVLNHAGAALLPSDGASLDPSPKAAVPGETRSSFHLYLLCLDLREGESLAELETRRDELIVRLAERGISANVHYKPLPLLSAYQKMGYRIEDFPNAYRAYAGSVSLPLYSSMRDEEQDEVIQACLDLLG